jgi:hypothetical protein
LQTAHTPLNKFFEIQKQQQQKKNKKKTKPGILMGMEEDNGIVRTTGIIFAKM